MFGYWEPWPENRKTTDEEKVDAAIPVRPRGLSGAASKRAASAAVLATTIRRCSNAFLPT